jgi:hypothetical protein
MLLEELARVASCSCPDELRYVATPAFRRVKQSQKETGALAPAVTSVQTTQYSGFLKMYRLAGGSPLAPRFEASV